MYIMNLKTYQNTCTFVIRNAWFNNYWINFHSPNDDIDADSKVDVDFVNEDVAEALSGIFLLDGDVIKEV